MYIWRFLYFLRSTEKSKYLDFGLSSGLFISIVFYFFLERIRGVNHSKKSRTHFSKKIPKIPKNPKIFRSLYSFGIDLPLGRIKQYCRIWGKNHPNVSKFSLSQKCFWYCSFYQKMDLNSLKVLELFQIAYSHSRSGETGKAEAAFLHF